MENIAAARVRSIFDKANFVRELGMELIEVGDDWCEATLKVQERHRQQHGFVHAGVIATLADHTGGGAARIASGERDVITIEFKINFLRPADGDKLLCRGRLLRAGKSVIVTEAEVFSISDAEQRLVAKLTQTLAVIG